MSLIFSNDNCSLISHEIYLNRIYQNASANDETSPKYQIRNDLFDLNIPYRQETANSERELKKRQRKILEKNADRVKHEYPNEYALIEKLKGKTDAFLKMCREKRFLLNDESSETSCTNERLRRFLSEWKSVEYPQLNAFNGGNDSSAAIVHEINSQTHLIPPKCRFFNINVNQLEKKEYFTSTFDLLTLDPPWWNKFVRRSRSVQRENGYEMLSNKDIANIPIAKWVSADRTLVAIWCTNAPSMINYVRNRLLAKWSLKLLATWFWIKITKYGETICDFDLPLKKQPFERIFIACHVDSTHEFSIPDEKLIFSVPSGIHSHKPPLHDLLRPFATQSDNEHSSLELFARYLLPNCTSIGLEVLKLQNLQLFCDETSGNESIEGNDKTIRK